MGNDPRIFYKRLRLKRGDISNDTLPLTLVNQFIFIVVSLCFSQTPGFQKLDNSNAFNKEYEQFPWPQWKVVVSFANPALTSDSFSVQQKSFNDIAPNKSFYKFLIENISGILTAKTNFGSFSVGFDSFEKGRQGL